jgi:hypothetical protein
MPLHWRVEVDHPAIPLRPGTVPLRWVTPPAVDVRGQWLNRGAETGGIVRGGKRWQDGMTWDMIDREITTLRKTPSKTEDSLTEELEWDLTLSPDLRARLQTGPQDQRVGPVIKDPKPGIPCDRFR